MEKVDIKPRGCWLWQGFVRDSGYGTFRNGSSGTVYAHRYAFELFVGPIPTGLEIDHLCRNTSCVNPDHLEPVTPSENLRRGSLGEWRTCDRLHPNDATRIGRRSDGRAYCRECQRVRERQRRADFAERTAKIKQQ